MFMEREEFRYGIKLGKIQFKYGAFCYALAICFLVQIMFGDYMDIIVNHYMGIEPDQLIEFSTGMLYCMVLYLVGFIIWGCIYKTNRTAQEIYPQTNKSRFVANILSDYIMVITMTASSFIINLSLYILLPLIVSKWGNAVLVDGMTMRDVLITTAVVCGYGLLIQSVVLFIFSCIRKFKLWTISVPCICLAWIAYDNNQFFTITMAIGGFYFQEMSFPLLIMKLVLTHLILNAISYLLEVYTEFRGSGMSRKQGIAFAIAIGMITICNIVVVGNLMFSVSDDTYNVTVEEMDEVEMGSADGTMGTEVERIIIDVSHLEEGTNIELETSGYVFIPNTERETVYYDSENEHYLYLYWDDLVVDGDDLVLKYFIGKEVYDGVDIYSYIQPELTYELVGNTLKIGYECMNPDVKILYINNGIAGRFKLDREVETNLLYGYGYIAATLYIQVE